MKKKPYISIITPNLNNGKYLEDTIRSVISQNMKNFEKPVVTQEKHIKNRETCWKHRDNTGKIYEESRKSMNSRENS